MPRKKQYQWKSGQDGDDFNDLPPSRSEKKRQSLALQEMGEELTRLGPQEVKNLDLPPDLAEALSLYGRISNHEGRRRQLQFIGRIMRELDPAPIRAALDARREKSATATAALHKAEQWRERLLAADDNELSSLIAAFFANLPAQPSLEQAEGATKREAAILPDDMRNMALAARKEAAENTAPHARRALFRALHNMLTSA